MPISQINLEAILKQRFESSEITVEDLAGDNDHYRAIIASPEFSGKTRIQQHQMVYEALKNTEAHDLHALSLKTIILNP